MLAGPEGFGFLSKDDNFGMMIHWILQADFREELDSLADESKRATFLVRFAGAALSARFYKRIRSELLVNFAGASPSLSEAWVDAEVAPWLHFRAGKFHYPISLERATTSIFFPLVDADMPSALLPSADAGIQVWGRLDGGLLEYDLALVNGATAGSPGGPGDVDVDVGKDSVGRVFAQPFLPLHFAPLSNLGIGVGAAGGRHNGTPTSPELPKLSSWGGLTYFAYRNDGTAAGSAVATGPFYRLVPQASWHDGPVSAYAEYVIGSDDVGGVRVGSEAYGVVVAVVPTGEESVPLHYVIPAHNFSPAEGHFGALEIAAAAGAVRIGDEAARLVSATSASRLTQSYAAGINWYPNLGVRVMADVSRFTFSLFPGAQPLRDESLLVIRCQVVL